MKFRLFFLSLGLVVVLGLGTAFWPRREAFPSRSKSPARSDEISAKKKFATKENQPWNFPTDFRTTPSDPQWPSQLDEIRQLDDEPARVARLQEVVNGVSESNIARAIEFFRHSEPAEMGAEAASGLLRRLAALDPMEAAASAQGLPPGGERIRALNDVAVVWSSADMPAAIEWVKTWSDAEERATGLVTLGTEAARADAGLALDLVVDLPPSPERDALIHHAAAQWATNTPKEAAGWAMQIGNADLRAQTLARVATEWAQHDPAAAATTAVSELPAGRSQDDAVMSIVERWAQKDPAAAEAWIQQFPEGPLKETAQQNLAALRSSEPSN